VNPLQRFTSKWGHICLLLLGFSLIAFLSSPSSAQTADEAPTEKQITATRINPHSPKIDGKLDDEVWQKANFVTNFTQKEPTEGEAAKNETEIAFVYDDDAIYIGARLLSADPDKIISTVARRDNGGTSERIIVSLDTYHNKRTAYTFAVTASGVRIDYYHSNDSEGDRDHGWDPVWKAKTQRNANGWTAEMRIPFTQLRFQNKNVQTWGINMNRWVPNTNEDSYWILVPKAETGWSSRMGELVGIEGIKPSRRIELMPFVAADGLYNKHEVEDGDPFHDGSEIDGRVGGDIKMGVGPNLTLEGTILPDFGQVEADPAVVNLSAFETFFDERRPFFTEGSQLFNGGGAGYFYSRRIGARPRFFPEGDFFSTPKSTSILGAAKLTGRLNSGLNVGLLGAFTQHEKASVYDADGGGFKKVSVEPATGYGVVRLNQELGSGGSTAGVILTGVERDMPFGGNLDNLLRRRALTGGTDWNLKFNDQKYELGGNVGFSRVEGSRESMLNTQESSARFYQRPDADYVELDTTLTSLSGWTSDLWFEKNSGKHWLWELAVSAESPGFELNDGGRLGTADDIDSYAELEYRENDPGKLFQNWRLSAGGGTGWNFGRVRQYSFIDLESRFTWKNYTGSFLGVEYFPAAHSDNLTRGGPLMGTGSSWNVHAEMWSSAQNKTTWNLWGGYSEGETGGWSYWTGGGVTVRPGSRWQISVHPAWEHWTSSRQYYAGIDTAGGGQDTYGARYVFSFIERSMIRLQTRLNFSFTPDMSLEWYGEPFAASGRYHNWGELEATGSKDLRFYGTDGTTITQTAEGVYNVTDGPNYFTIEQEDFNVISYRTNLVLRWEWRAGSTMFLVWQKNNSGFESIGSLVSPRSLVDAIGADGDNFIAIKITYWIPFL